MDWHQINRNGKDCTFGNVRPAKIQISLRIRAVWSESSLCAFRIANDAKFIRENNEDSDQTARMRRLIWVFAGRTCQKVRFLTSRSAVWSNNIIRICLVGVSDKITGQVEFAIDINVLPRLDNKLISYWLNNVQRGSILLTRF